MYNALMRMTMGEHVAGWVVCLVVAVNVQALLPAVEPNDLPPLNTLGTQLYQGMMGGLYADGRNEPWGEHAAALRRVGASIVPLDADGNPDPHGKIAVVGIGASVCVQIFAKLEELAPQADGVRPQIVFVNCAKGGQDVNKIADPAGRYWSQAEAALERAGVTPRQVQVAWYQSDDLRDQRADFPGRPKRLKESIADNLRQAREHFPNLRLCYHSARHTTAFMPNKSGSEKHAEPRPYLVGWAVKWLIEEQAAGQRADLRFEGDRSVMPLCAWATYFWTMGDRPRQDGYRWSSDDVGADGVHLSPTGQTRVAQELLDFWRNDPYAKIWFAADGRAESGKADGRNAEGKHGKAPASKAPPGGSSAGRFPKEAGPNEPAWIVNGMNKMPKLQRLLGTTENVRAVVRDTQGKEITEIQDVFHKHTDLNQLVGTGAYRLEFFDAASQRIKLTQEVGDTVHLK
jgi:hypothetical protein